MPKKECLIGQRFGRLTVVEATKERQDHYCVWRCRCDCGGEILVNTKRLKGGTVKDCGCIPKMTVRQGHIAEDLSGRVFGHLTVIRKAPNRGGRTCWVCQCDCGREKEVISRNLKSGRVKSCGCHTYDRPHNRVDLTGRRFGRLTVIEATEKRDSKKSVYWRCVCDCGRETEATEGELMQGLVMSCGCLQRENQQKIAQRLHRIDGTCIEILEKRKYRRDNTSGFRGVLKTDNGRYRAYINFKRKRYYLGTYDDYETAVQERMKAEEVIYNGFLADYYQWKEKTDQDPDWSAEHPLIFEVEKKDGHLVVSRGTKDSFIIGGRG